MYFKNIAAISFKSAMIEYLVSPIPENLHKDIHCHPNDQSDNIHVRFIE